MLTEQFGGRMFIAGIHFPAFLLAVCFGILILFLAFAFPNYVGGQDSAGYGAEDWAESGPGWISSKGRSSQS